MDNMDPEEARYHVAASASSTAGGTRVLKTGDTFALVNRFGDIHRAGGNEQGLFHRGTRFLARLELRIAGRRPLFLSSGMLDDDIVLAVDLSNPDLPAPSGDATGTVVPYGTVHIARSILVGDGVCVERFLVTNHSSSTLDVPLSLHFSADFVDLFEVRGTMRDRHGEILPATLGEASVELSYRGLDRVVRRTRIAFEPAPTRLGPLEASFLLRLESKQTSPVHVMVACEVGTREHVPVPLFERALERATAHALERRDRECNVRTSNEAFNAWLDRSRADLHMLTSATPQGPYPYAGVPWFSTPFGRDGIWTAIQTLWMSSSYAAGVLRFLAATQARASDDANDAEPGKIVHEIRDGEMAALREIPFGRYYGSVDSTPLFLMLAAQYYRSTADTALVRELWPNLLAAVDWIDRYGDRDGDGFVEYGRRSADGLVQQGWKDSNDSIFHDDGALASAPIALCEVQGYVYAAKKGMSGLAAALGQPALAERFEREAAELRARFDAAFWCEELGTYALALDGDKRPCRVRSSNAAHCLYTGISTPERAARLRDQLLAQDMFSGWGVRTLSSHEVRYNPMSYHNGSIWPHDNSIAAEGIAAYGYREEALCILAGLYGASNHVDINRLPELFCGFGRRPGQGPTLYPVACSPQAWAAGSVFLLLKAVLGMDIDACSQRISFRSPALPAFLGEIWISNLRVGSATVDLRLERYPGDVGVNILRKSDQVQIVTLR